MVPGGKMEGKLQKKEARGRGQPVCGEPRSWRSQGYFQSLCFHPPSHPHRLRPPPPASPLSCRIHSLVHARTGWSLSLACFPSPSPRYFNAGVSWKRVAHFGILFSRNALPSLPTSVERPNDWMWSLTPWLASTSAKLAGMT